MLVSVLGGCSNCLDTFLDLVCVGKGVGLSRQDRLNLDPQGHVGVGAGLEDVADTQEGDAIVLCSDLAAQDRTAQDRTGKWRRGRQQTGQ